MSDLMDDLIDRLRDGVERQASGKSALWDSIMKEAADEIERQAKRIEELEAEKYVIVSGDSLRKDNETLKADNERLRAALLHTAACNNERLRIAALHCDVCDELSKAAIKGVEGNG